MSDKALHNPHLKENPFKVPDGYFEQILACWTVRENTLEEIREVPERKGDRFVRLLKPQLQLAAAFLILFGIGYVLMTIIGKNKEAVRETEELSFLSEWSFRGFDHRMVSELVLEDFMEQQDHLDRIDPDIDDLVDYMNYPGFDPVDFHIETNNK